MVWEHLSNIQVELLIGIGMPVSAGIAFFIRQMWNKTKCFHLMEDAIDRLEDDANCGRTTHKELFERINVLDKHISNIEGKLDILLKK